MMTVLDSIRNLENFSFGGVETLTIKNQKKSLDAWKVVFLLTRNQMWYSDLSPPLYRKIAVFDENIPYIQKYVEITSLTP